jgi:hypothetical protein
MGRKARRPIANTSTGGVDDATMLARLQSVGLFVNVSLASFAASMVGSLETDRGALGDAGRDGFEDGDDAPAGRVVSYAAAELLTRSEGIALLHAPQSAKLLKRLLEGLEPPCPAIASSRARIRLKDLDPRRRIVRLEFEGRATEYRWNDPSELVGVYDRALELADDPRRFVLLQEENRSERFLLATPQQREVLASLDLIDFYGMPRLPPPFVPPWKVTARSAGGASGSCTGVVEGGQRSVVIAGRLEKFPTEQPVFATLRSTPGFVAFVCTAAGKAQSAEVARALAASLTNEDAASPHLEDLGLDAGWASLVVAGDSLSIVRRGDCRAFVRSARSRGATWARNDLRFIEGEATLGFRDDDVAVLATESLWSTLGDEAVEDVLLQQAPDHWSLLLLEKVRQAKGVASVSVVVAIAGAET